MSAAWYINIGTISSSITIDMIKIIIFEMTSPNLIIGPVMIIIYLIIICI